MSFLARLRDFVEEQSNNYRVLLVRDIVASFMMQLVSNFNDLYITALGASALELSSIRAFGSGVSAIISMPAGWLSDVYSLKKIMTLGMLVQIVSVTFYAFAQDWTWIYVAIVFATITMTLVFRIGNIIVANSLADSNRATGYGIRTTIMQFFSIFSPTIGGLLVHFFGGISVEGIRPLYFIQLIGYSLVTIFVALKLTDVETVDSVDTREFFGHYREMLQSGSHLKLFAFLQALGSITWGMSMPFPFVYAADFKGADSLLIGYMGTVFVLASMVLAIPMGALADSRGRKFTIYLTRPFFYLSYLLLVLAPKGAWWVLLLAWACRGVMMSSRAWMTMSMEMVPKEYRGRWTGFSSLLQNLVRVPAMLVGGYIYESINPALVFLIPIAVDALIRLPLLTRVPETMKIEDLSMEDN
ncbi:MAG: MFS transporter [Candidatus Bathyarchaeia archaeon]